MIRTSQCDLHVEQVGAGPALVCLHGGAPGATGAANFASTAPRFADSYTVVMPDLPCFGRSTIVEDSDEPWIEIASRAVVELLEGLGAGPVQLLGNSAGGAVAAKVAGARPDLVDHLVLMGSAGVATSLLTPEPMEGVRLLRSYYADPSVEAMRRIVTTFIHDQSATELIDEVVAVRHAASVAPGAEAGYKRVYKHGPASLRVTDEVLAAIEAPTLLLWGRDDRFVGLDKALHLLTAVPDARLVVLPRCGHWVQVERADDFELQVKAFLEGRSTGG